MQFNDSCFVLCTSLVMAPLFAAVASKKYKDFINWNTQTEQLFADTKSALATSVLLHLTQHNVTTALT